MYLVSVLVDNMPPSTRRQNVYDVCDDDGCCRRHPNVRLVKPHGDGQGWRILRRRCPECIDEERPIAAGDDNDIGVEPRLTAQLRMELEVEAETANECLGRCLGEIVTKGVLVLLVVVAFLATYFFLKGG